MDLNGKTAIVTGGAVRLGRALALAVAGAGANVVVHYGSSTQAAKETQDEITALGGQAVTVQADFRDPLDAAEDLFRTVDEAFGGAEILINSAAIFEPGNLASTSEAEWDRHFAINLKTPFFLCQKFAEQLSAGRRGQIVNIADWRATRPDVTHLAYSLTKGALAMLTKGLAVDLAPRVQVNAIAPGAILPPSGAGEEYLDRLSQQIPLARSGSTAEVAATLLFLLGSDFVTGEIVHVTGGEEL